MSGKVSESVRRAIADPLVLGSQPAAKWQSPTVPPTTADLRAAIAAFRAALEPAPAKDARWCLGKLAKGHRLKLDESAKEAWLGAMTKLPIDLLREATLAALQADAAPTIETFAQQIAEKLHRRRTDLQRTQAMREGALRPKTAPAFEPEPDDVRLRTLVRFCLGRGDQAQAARYERELAALENREPAEWATGLETGIPAKAPAERVSRPIRPQPHTEAAMLRARAKFWKRQPGAEQYARNLARQADDLQRTDEPVGEAA